MVHWSIQSVPDFGRTIAVLGGDVIYHYGRFCIGSCLKLHS